MVPLGLALNDRERVSQSPVSSSHYVIISEFMIACSALDSEENFTKHVPEMVRRLREIGLFNPTQPIRDQSTRFPRFSSRSRVREADPAASARQKPAVELREASDGAVQRPRIVHARAGNRAAPLPGQHRYPEGVREFPALRGDSEAPGDGSPVDGDRRGFLVGVSELRGHGDHHSTAHRAGDYLAGRLSAFLADYEHESYAVRVETWNRMKVLLLVHSGHCAADYEQDGELCGCF